jgi:hypothetical protein
MTRKKRRWRFGSRIVFALLLSGVSAGVYAQELSPRAYWPAPVGTRILALAYAHASGDEVVDPAIPVSGANSSLNKAIVGYFHTTSLFGLTTNFVVDLPYAWGNTTGILNGMPARRDVSNLGDMSLTMSVNILGAPAMNGKEFLELTANPRPLLAASLKLVAPTGNYEADRLINVGANRWAAKAELGYILPLVPDWHLEVEGGAWLFADNDDFQGRTREQDPIYAIEAHLVHRFGGGRWASVEANYFSGGRTTVDGVARDDKRGNSNIGVSMLFPFGKRQSLRIAVSTAVKTSAGGDYHTFILNYIRLL